jgi:hypothetical protein
MSTAAPKERGKHEAEDFSKELLLGSQTAFELDDEVIGQAQIMKGLAERFDITLGLALLVYMAFLRIEAAPFESLRLLVSVPSGWGHGGFLRLVCDWAETEGNHVPRQSDMATQMVIVNRAYG